MMKVSLTCPSRLVTAAALVASWAVWSSAAPPPPPHSHQLSYGGMITAGGRDGIDQALQLVQTLGLPELPWLPHPISRNSLTALDLVLYSCGGSNSSQFTTYFTADCYTLDMSQEKPEWIQSFQLPQATTYPEAAVMGDKIWYIYGNYTYVFNPKTMTFKTHRSPFDSSFNFCTASNTTHVYVLGVGESINELWFSTASDTPSWQKMDVVGNFGYDFRCLLYQEQIFITCDSRAQMLDTNTAELRQVGDLVEQRHSHGMFVLDGLPAVVGGIDREGSTPLTSIETFNPFTSKWTTDSRSLAYGIRSFGLTQVIT